MKILNSMLKIALVSTILTIPMASYADEGIDKPVTMNAHPSKDGKSVAIVKPSKPLPAKKHEMNPMMREDMYWIPGDYYWDGDDWRWESGFWMDQPMDDITWIPGHWVNHWWGVSWVPGYWV